MPHPIQPGCQGLETGVLLRRAGDPPLRGWGILGWGPSPPGLREGFAKGGLLPELHAYTKAQEFGGEWVFWGFFLVLFLVVFCFFLSSTSPEVLKQTPCSLRSCKPSLMGLTGHLGGDISQHTHP